MFVSVDSKSNRYKQMLLNDFSFNKIVLQPTTTCNLNCTYCYLGDRSTKYRMDIQTAKCIAESIAIVNKPILLIWHGGEPLALGKARFVALLKEFEQLREKKLVRHCIQTNATLIDDEWCAVFNQYEIKVGVSTDGPPAYNTNRVDWGEKSAAAKIEKGIRVLVKNRINFSIICVLSERHLSEAAFLYDYFVGLGCSSIGFNSPEREGSNNLIGEDFPLIKQFWSDLYTAWMSNPVVRVRELTYAISWMDSSIRRGTTTFTPKLLDLIPTVSWDGNVVFLSPEFSGVDAAGYDNFIVGNIMKNTLDEILSILPNARYYREYLDGLSLCETNCEYFSFCGGGQASNKYFEHGKFNVMETSYCRNVKKRLIEGVLDAIQ